MTRAQNKLFDLNLRVLRAIAPELKPNLVSFSRSTGFPPVVLSVELSPLTLLWFYPEKGTWTTFMINLDPETGEVAGGMPGHPGMVVTPRDVNPRRIFGTIFTYYGALCDSAEAAGIRTGEDHDLFVARYAQFRVLFEQVKATF